jgi:hypothetical protein
VVPMILKPLSPSGPAPAGAGNNYSEYFKANQAISTLMTFLGLLLTFGTVCPPLGAAVLLSIIAWGTYAKLKVGRLLLLAKEANIKQYVQLIEHECDGVGTASVLRNSFWMLLTVTCLFYTIFLFDILGDVVGVGAAYWVLIVLPLLPLVIYVLHKLFKRYVTAPYRLTGIHTHTHLEEPSFSGNTKESTCSNGSCSYPSNSRNTATGAIAAATAAGPIVPPTNNATATSTFMTSTSATVFAQVNPLVASSQPRGNTSGSGIGTGSSGLNSVNLSANNSRSPSINSSSSSKSGGGGVLGLQSILHTQSSAPPLEGDLEMNIRSGGNTPPPEQHSE